MRACVCVCVIELVHVLVHACVIELVHVLVTVSSMRMRALSLHGYVRVYVCLYVLTGACLWLCDCVCLVYSICACVRVCVLHMYMRARVYGCVTTYTCIRISLYIYM